MTAQWQYNHLVIPLILSIISIVILIVIASRQRKSSLVMTFILFMICALILTTASLLEIITLNFELSLFFADISFLGITFIPPTWIGLVMIYTGKEANFKRLLPFLLVIPIATNIIIWTNSFHSLWRVDSTRDLTLTWFPVTDYDYGIWFNTVHIAYSYVLAISANLILLQSVFIRKNTYRGQIVTLLVTLNLPLLVEVLNLLGIAPIPYFNASTLVFSVSGALLAWSILDLRFFDVTPIARDLLIENMKDIMIVVDDQSRIRDVNPSARQVVFDNQRGLIGKQIHQLLPDSHQLITHLENDLSDNRDFVIQLPNRDNQIYELRTSDIAYPSGKQAGRLLLLRDVTIRQQTEQAYYQEQRQVAILEERQRIARDLHDSVNQTLFVAGTFADLMPMAIESKPERLQQYAFEIQKLISSTSAQLRLILFELHPDALTNTELGKLLKQLCQAHVDTTGISVETNLAPQILLDEKAQIGFYRIAQEALHNINKHADATEVYVHLTKVDHQIKLVIQDNGDGFDPMHVSNNQFGIANMRQRAADINGTLLIESHLSTGTTITLCKTIT